MGTLALHYFPADFFGWRQPIWWWQKDYFYGHKVIWDLAGTGSTLFLGRIYWRQPIEDYLRFVGNWLYIIFLVDCFGGIWFGGDGQTIFSGQQVIWDLAGTGTKLFSGGLFWDQFFSDYLRFGRNWLYNILGQNVLETANWVVTARLSWLSDDYLRFGGNWLYIFFGELF